MSAISRAFAALTLMLGSSISLAAPEWYVGYSFIYGETASYCSFMRFRADSYSVEQADILYNHLADELADNADAGSTFAHTLPSAAFAKGQSGEQMASEFLSKGVGACSVVGQPVSGVLFISSFGCDYQNQLQMCTRLYVDTGSHDATAYGIGPGPAGVGGIFIRRPVWDASAGMVYAGKSDLPSAVKSVLELGASGLDFFRE